MQTTHVLYLSVVGRASNIRAFAVQYHVERCLEVHDLPSVYGGDFVKSQATKETFVKDHWELVIFAFVAT